VGLWVICNVKSKNGEFTLDTHRCVPQVISERDVVASVNCVCICISISWLQFYSDLTVCGVCIYVHLCTAGLQASSPALGTDIRAYICIDKCDRILNEKRLLALSHTEVSVCLSVRPHVAVLLLWNGFPWNFIYLFIYLFIYWLIDR